MSDRDRSEEEALQAHNAAAAEVLRLARERRTSALEHVKAALADYTWLFDQRLNQGASDRLVLSKLQQLERDLSPPNER